MGNEFWAIATEDGLVLGIGPTEAEAINDAVFWSRNQIDWQPVGCHAPVPVRCSRRAYEFLQEHGMDHDTLDVYVRTYTDHEGLQQPIATSYVRLADEG